MNRDLEILNTIGLLIESEAADSKWLEFVRDVQRNATDHDVFDHGAIVKMAELSETIRRLTIERDEAYCKGQAAMCERAAQAAAAEAAWTAAEQIRKLKPEGK